jgi:hypothetical protein
MNQNKTRRRITFTRLNRSPSPAPSFASADSSINSIGEYAVPIKNTSQNILIHAPSSIYSANISMPLAPSKACLTTKMLRRNTGTRRNLSVLPGMKKVNYNKSSMRKSRKARKSRKSRR